MDISDLVTPVDRDAHCQHIIFRIHCYALSGYFPALVQTASFSAAPTIITENSSMLPPQAPSSH